MSNTTLMEPRMTGPSPEDLKVARRHSRKAGLFEPELLKIAFRQSLIMLRPDIQWKNPVMFTVEVGAVLTIIYTIAKLLGYQSAAGVGYLLALDFWLLATLLFANFASAIAEARGKAQADAVDQQFPEPVSYFRAGIPPVNDHAELRQAERDKNIDAVEDHQEIHRPMRREHQEQRKSTHQDDAVVGYKSIAQSRKARRKPAIQRHVRQYARAVEKAGLGGDEQQGRLGSEGDDDEG